jgi:hypothetical protein
MSLLIKAYRHFQMSTTKLLSHELLLPLVGRELSDQISITATPLNSKAHITARGTFGG